MLFPGSFAQAGDGFIRSLKNDPGAIDSDAKDSGAGAIHRECCTGTASQRGAKRKVGHGITLLSPLRKRCPELDSRSLCNRLIRWRR